MAITYSIDETKGKVYSAFDENISADDFNTHFRELRGNKSFRSDYIGLLDWRRVKKIEINPTSMMHISSACPWGRRSYRAIVSSKIGMYGMSRIFQNLSNPHNGMVQVFQDFHDAETWLASLHKQ